MWKMKALLLVIRNRVYHLDTQLKQKSLGVLKSGDSLLEVLNGVNLINCEK